LRMTVMTDSRWAAPLCRLGLC